MGQQIVETGLINSDRRCESVLKSTIVSSRYRGRASGSSIETIG